MGDSIRISRRAVLGGALLGGAAIGLPSGAAGASTRAAQVRAAAKAKKPGPGTLPNPSVSAGHRHHSGDHHHCRGDDGEPHLRQCPRHAERSLGAECRVCTGCQRPADKLESVAQVADRVPSAGQRCRPEGLSDAHRLPAGQRPRDRFDRLPVEYMGGRPHLVRRRQDGRVREEPERPSVHGLLRLGLSTVRQLLGRKLSGMHQLLLFGDGADLPEPSLLHGRYIARQHQRRVE